jgi:hypothetical protein
MMSYLRINAMTILRGGQPLYFFEVEDEVMYIIETNQLLDFRNCTLGF